MMNFLQSKKKYKTGIVLSGGASRGFAHLGVLQALNEADIYPDVISGVSAGAIVGAFYADGKKPIDIVKLFQGKRFKEMASFNLRRNGLLNISGLRKFMKENLESKNLEDLKIPMVVSATNMRTGKSAYFDKGDIIDIVMASSSIPVLFQIARVNGEVYMDGGIVDNLPVEPIKDKCRKIIAVHVNPIGEETDINGLVKIAFRSFHLSVAAGVSLKKDDIDLFIEPLELKDYGLLDLSKAKEMFDIGYDYTKKIINENKHVIPA